MTGYGFKVIGKNTRKMQDAYTRYTECHFGAHFYKCVCFGIMFGMQMLKLLLSITLSTYSILYT